MGDGDGNDGCGDGRIGGGVVGGVCDNICNTLSDSFPLFSFCNRISIYLSSLVFLKSTYLDLEN